MDYQIKYENNVSDKSCTLLITQLIKTMSTSNEGDIFRITTTDRESIIDIPLYCKLTGNKLIYSLMDEVMYIYFIEKSH